ncbi:hypothetical protein ANCDUO_07794 [Ancylostoma duodenale]|uniref:Uncharacterized protein n=1 Tax=Ancylostoma duodenale TaxID=51022 RepID=A0A0C2GL52_9BILA|nr:hypothetical protein ANCDUO_07794 [Ancylostoma duodenale]
MAGNGLRVSSFFQCDISLTIGAFLFQNCYEQSYNEIDDDKKFAARMRAKEIFPTNIDLW